MDDNRNGMASGETEFGTVKMEFVATDGGIEFAAAATAAVMSVELLLWNQIAEQVVQQPDKLATYSVCYVDATRILSSR